MKLAAPYDWAAVFNCPHCGVPLNVEDPEDFEDNYGPMCREEDHVSYCPGCDKAIEFHVTWQPSYPYDPKAVDE